MILPFNRFLGWMLTGGIGSCALVAVIGIVANLIQGRVRSAMYFGVLLVMCVASVYFLFFWPEKRACSLANSRAGAADAGLMIAGGAHPIVTGEGLDVLMQWARPTNMAMLVASPTGIEIVSVRKGEVMMTLSRSDLAAIEAARPLPWLGCCSAIRVRTADGGTVYLHVLSGGLRNLIGPSEKFVKTAVGSLRAVLDL